MGLFEITPEDTSNLVTLAYQVTLSDGTTLPSCVQYTVEADSIVFTALATANQNNVAADTYRVMISAVATLGTVTSTKSIIFDL